MNIKREFIGEHLIKDIKSQIFQGKLKPGDTLLSLNQLKDKYKISRSSAQKSINLLIAEGITKSTPGKGVTVSKEALNQPSPFKHLGLSYPLCHTEQIEAIKNYIFEKNGLLTINSNLGQQEAEKEKDFIEKLNKTQLSGVILFPGSTPPYNTVLYSKLRQQNIKAAILTPYRYDMAGDVCFLADYRYGGYLATSYFACMGIKDVFFVHLDYDSYYIKLQNEGFTTAVAENGLNNLGSLIIKRDSCEKIKNELNQLPAGVGIVANSRKAAKYALEHMNTCGKELGKDFHIFACEGGDIPAIELPENIPYLDFPSGKILWEAVDYLLNDHIPADFIFHKYFKPEVINPDPQVLNKLKTKLNK